MDKAYSFYVFDSLAHSEGKCNPSRVDETSPCRGQSPRTRSVKYVVIETPLLGTEGINIRSFRQYTGTPVNTWYLQGGWVTSTIESCLVPKSNTKDFTPDTSGR